MASLEFDSEDSSLLPAFGKYYDEAKHGQIFKEELNVDHLSPLQESILTAVAKKHWRVFSKKSVTTPVKDYECEIDTGDAKPIRCKNPSFGPLETHLVEKTTYYKVG